MECRGAGGPPAGRMASGKRAKMRMFSVISRTERRDLQVAPLRMVGGRETKGMRMRLGGRAPPPVQSGKTAGGEREGIYKKREKTASRTMKDGREADGMPGRGHPVAPGQLLNGSMAHPKRVGGKYEQESGGLRE